MQKLKEEVQVSKSSPMVLKRLLAGNMRSEDRPDGIIPGPEKLYKYSLGDNFGD